MANERGRSNAQKAARGAQLLKGAAKTAGGIASGNFVAAAKGAVEALSPKVIWHRRSRDHVTIRFFVSTLEHDKEISIIPVKPGMERFLVGFAEDKFGRTKCEVVMFLLENRRQMKLLKPDCCYRFALVGRKGVTFYKPE